MRVITICDICGKVECDGKVWSIFHNRQHLCTRHAIKSLWLHLQGKSI